MAVFYEWDVETVSDGETVDHEDGECVDHNHCTTFLEACSQAAWCAPDGFRYQIVLVRDDDKGRAWAYVDDNGALPDYFTDADGIEAHRVPQRFKEQS